MITWSVDVAGLAAPSGRPHHLAARPRAAASSDTMDKAARRREQTLALRVEQVGEHLQRVRAAQERRAERQQLASHHSHDRLGDASSRRHSGIQAKRRKLNAHLDHVEQVRAQAQAMERQKRAEIEAELAERIGSTAARRQKLLSSFPRVSADHGRQMVAAATLQSWWRWAHLHKALRLFFRTPLARLAGAEEVTFEQLGAQLADAKTLRIVQHLFQRLRPILAQSPRAAAALVHPHRVFLSAFMMQRFPATVLSNPDGALEQALAAAAHTMLTCFHGWCNFAFCTPLKRSQRELMGARFKSFARAWVEFTHAFRAWQRADHQAIVDGLVLHFRELEALRATVSETEGEREVWWPGIDQQQAAILKRLVGLGERELVAGLEREASQQPGQPPRQRRTSPPPSSLLHKKRKRTVSSESSSGSSTPQASRPSTPLARSPPAAAAAAEESSGAGGATAAAAVSASIERLNGLVNAQLAHEIALDDRFQLPEPTAELLPAEAELVASLRADVAAGVYLALVPALGHLGELLAQLTLPRQTMVRAQLAARLDLPALAQQAQHGALNMAECQAFVLDTAARLCSAQRDAAVAALRSVQDPVDFYAGMLILLRQMRADLVNFQIAAIRPHLKQYAVDYESAKFAACVAQGDITLDRTRAWLRAAMERTGGSGEALATLDDGLVALAAGEPSLADPAAAPETWIMDAARLGGHVHALQTAILTACCHSLVISAHPRLNGQSQFSRDLREAVHALAVGEANPFAHIPSIALHVEQLVRAAYQRLQAPAPASETEQRLRDALAKLASPDHPVRGLLTRRAHDLLRRALKVARNEPVPAPAARLHGLELVAELLHPLVERMAALANHNRRVHGAIYDQIMLEERAWKSTPAS